VYHENEDYSVRPMSGILRNITSIPSGQFNPPESLLMFHLTATSLDLTIDHGTAMLLFACFCIVLALARRRRH
jgi:hypothetical protein